MLLLLLLLVVGVAAAAADFERVVIPFAGLRIQESITNLIYNSARVLHRKPAIFREKESERESTCCGLCRFSFLLSFSFFFLIILILLKLQVFGLQLKHFIERLKAVKSMQTMLLD